MYETKVFKTWPVFSSFQKISFSSIKVIFFLDVILSERKGLTVFQKALLSVTFFHQGYYNTVFVFLNSDTT